MKLKLKITGKKVHDVGYRAFLLESAEDFRMQGFFAQNKVDEGQQAVIVYIEGSDASVEKFQKISKMQRPDKADVSDIAFEDCSDDVEDIKSFAAIFQARQLRKGISAIIIVFSKTIYNLYLAKTSLSMPYYSSMRWRTYPRN